MRIDPIVRGICDLRPGIEGLSGNIRVRSIIGQFREHSLVHYFFNDGEEEVMCASTDWMDRDFFRRTETCFATRKRSIKKRPIADLKLFHADYTRAWELQASGTCDRITPRKDEPVSDQSARLEQLATISWPIDPGSPGETLRHGDVAKQLRESALLPARKFAIRNRLL